MFKLNQITYGNLLQPGGGTKTALFDVIFTKERRVNDHGAPWQMVQQT